MFKYFQIWITFRVLNMLDPVLINVIRVQRVLFLSKDCGRCSSKLLSFYVLLSVVRVVVTDETFTFLGNVSWLRTWLVVGRLESLGCHTTHIHQLFIFEFFWFELEGSLPNIVFSYPLWFTLLMRNLSNVKSTFPVLGVAFYPKNWISNYEFQLLQHLISI